MKAKALVRPLMLIFVVLLLAGSLLSGCAGAQAGAPTALPTLMLDSGGATSEASGGGSGSGGVTASGMVVPARQAQLASSSGGTVMEVTVAVGDQVEAGQVVVRLAGIEKLRAAADAAAFDQLAAQQELDQLTEQHAADLAAAQLRLAQAKIDLHDAERDRQSMDYRRASQATIDGLQADYIMAQRELKDAEDFFSGLGSLDENDLVRAQGLSNLSAAQKARDRALANLNYAMALPNDNEIAKAEATLQIAQAELALAQAEVDKLADGPDPTRKALAEARLANAGSQAAAAQAALADVEIKAPFSGSVGRVQIQSGEWAAPGQPLLVLAELNRLQVETTDLSERDIPTIQVGQAVTVYIKAINQDISGVVSEISPLADTLGGDVVYTTIIDLDSVPPELRAGMSAEVEYH